MKSETCARCGQEVRYGVRDERAGWWHREPVDHNPAFGVLSTPELRQAAMTAWANRNQESEDQEAEKAEIPEPEVRATPIDVGDERLPGGAKQVINAARKAGWTATASYARGPWMHSTRWIPTSVCDHVLVRLVDKTGNRAVASWRDGALENAWWIDQDGLEAVNSKTLKERIKRDPSE